MQLMQKFPAIHLVVHVYFLGSVFWLWVRLTNYNERDKGWHDKIMFEGNACILHFCPVVRMIGMPGTHQNIPE